MSCVKILQCGFFVVVAFASVFSSEDIKMVFLLASWKKRKLGKHLAIMSGFHVRWQTSSLFFLAVAILVHPQSP